MDEYVQQVPPFQHIEQEFLNLASMYCERLYVCNSDAEGKPTYTAVTVCRHRIACLLICIYYMI